ncbi:MAG: DUF72 domain-containing protein [candidate division WOR-3 bacterium]|nr:MAG: DUF72 domain-containing protein [candidate division WOR-3 bacterium]
MIKVGCCGFPVGKEKYFKKFSVIEIQSTFYDFVRETTIRKWRAEAPKDFEFVIKVPQFITHPTTSPTYRKVKKLEGMDPAHLGNFQPTEEVFYCYNKTVEYATILRTKLLVFQSPPRFSPDKQNVKNMEKFFRKIERKGLILAWESRGIWQPEQVKNICAKLDLIDVVDPFVRDSVHPVRKPWSQGVAGKSEFTTTKTPSEFSNGVHGKIFYYRLHGGNEYHKKFEKKELVSLYKEIKNKSGYVMFNNISMFQDAQKLRNLIAEIKKR